MVLEFLKISMGKEIFISFLYSFIAAKKYDSSISKARLIERILYAFKHETMVIPLKNIAFTWKELEAEGKAIVRQNFNEILEKLNENLFDNDCYNEFQIINNFVQNMSTYSETFIAKNLFDIAPITLTQTDRNLILDTLLPDKKERAKEMKTYMKSKDNDREKPIYDFEVIELAEKIDLKYNTIKKQDLHCKFLIDTIIKISKANGYSKTLLKEDVKLLSKNLIFISEIENIFSYFNTLLTNKEFDTFLSLVNADIEVKNSNPFSSNYTEMINTQLLDSKKKIVTDKFKLELSNFILFLCEECNPKKNNLSKYKNELYKYFIEILNMN
jgi:hypothetical protein